jgi:hypothetical protein
MQAGRLVTTGIQNAIFGGLAADALTDADFNTAIGYAALTSDTLGSRSTAIGYNTLTFQNFTTATNSNNTAVGFAAGQTLTTGKGNTLIGTFAGYSLTTGVSNTFVGMENTNEFGAGHLVTTGSRNTILGGYNGNQGSLDIRTASNQIVLSDGDGNPRVHVDSNGTTSLFSGTSNTLELNTSSNSAGSNNLIRGFSDSDIISGGTVRFVVFPSGNVQNSNNSYGAISDQKLKENIADAGSQWDDIKAIRVRKYSLIADSETTANRLGVVAQELEASGMSGLVEEYTDLGPNDEDLGTTTKGVKYSVLYMKAIKALQEAMTKIEDLEARVATLEAN